MKTPPNKRGAKVAAKAPKLAIHYHEDGQLCFPFKQIPDSFATVEKHSALGALQHEIAQERDRLHGILKQILLMDNAAAIKAATVSSGRHLKIGRLVLEEFCAPDRLKLGEGCHAETPQF
jgi:hypothetical protein